MYMYIYKNARCVDIGISSSLNKSLFKPPPINKPNLSLSHSSCVCHNHEDSQSHQTKPTSPKPPQNVPPLHPLPPSSQRQKRPHPSNPPHPSPKSPTNQLFNHKTLQPHLHLVRQQPLIRRANFFSISDFERRVEKCYWGCEGILIIIVLFLVISRRGRRGRRGKRRRRKTTIGIHYLDFTAEY